ncbi:hypothetical protein AWH56_025340 [Anaerobacillus isosaccharinicus]|uniref:Uncharacterized protein n=1 Tax=Anaerobacillus isosaccharinicus TaxID=1532552 RepID=A0A1S2M6Q2_9BACI|nr:hypothetical protein [Anaerobacillus isosaccharinicus]MBA5585766.1 hypothetical protein [Anaerobacillus isosaccharinicus]QOY35934.1 hypothetical protein AWH56_025340 [Anaerobacillus isosaccharinicus]
MNSFEITMLLISLIILVIVIGQFLLIIKMRNEYKKSLVTKEDFPYLEDETIHEKLKDELIATVLLKMLMIRNAVQKQTSNIHVKLIARAPKDTGIDKVLLTKVFSPQEVEIINKFWELFNQYRKDYWISNNGHLKTVFSGDLDKKTGDAGKLVFASDQLVLNLDKLLSDFQNRNKEIN